MLADEGGFIGGVALTMTAITLLVSGCCIRGSRQVGCWRCPLLKGKRCLGLLRQIGRLPAACSRQRQQLSSPACTPAAASPLLVLSRLGSECCSYRSTQQPALQQQRLLPVQPTTPRCSLCLARLPTHPLPSLCPPATTHFVCCCLFCPPQGLAVGFVLLRVEGLVEEGKL